MIPQLYRSSNQSHIALNSAQLDEIVAAILAGKYSWACFLLLRCAGYNPLDYIPYRTYNRLIKENCQIGKTKKAEDPSAIDKIGDLDYLEVVRDSKPTVQGGHQVQELREESLGTVSYNSYSPQKPKFYITLKTHIFQFWGT